MRKQPRFPASQGPGATLSSWGGTWRGRSLCSILRGAPLTPGELGGSLLWCSSLDGSRPAAGLQESKGRLPGLSRRGRASLGSHHLPPPRSHWARKPPEGWWMGKRRAERTGRGERGLLGQGRTASATTGTGVAVSRRPLPPRALPAGGWSEWAPGRAQRRGSIRGRHGWAPTPPRPRECQGSPYSLLHPADTSSTTWG